MSENKNKNKRENNNIQSKGERKREMEKDAIEEWKMQRFTTEFEQTTRNC